MSWRYALNTHLIIKNKKASFNYEIIQTFECGVKLLGSEVKSVRQKSISINEAYVTITKQHVVLKNANIQPYSHSSHTNHNPTRERILLLRRMQISKLRGMVSEKGMSIVPTKIYLKKGLIKVEIALVKGKKLHDKRQDEKKKDQQRQIQNALKHSI